MKKIYVVLITFILSFCVYSAEVGENYFEPKLGVGINFGVDSNETSTEFEIEGQSSYGLETYYRASDRIDFGVGIAYVEASTTKKNPDGTKVEDETKRMPVYLAAKVHLFPNWQINPYLKFMFGYQYIIKSDIDDLQDGKYLGAAVGLDLMNLTIENYVSIEESYNHDEDFEAAIGFGFTIGWKF